MVSLHQMSPSSKECIRDPRHEEKIWKKYGMQETVSRQISTTFNGGPNAVLSPDEPHKHLGVQMTMLGDFSAEKEHFLKEMRQRLAALKEDRALPRRENFFCDGCVLPGRAPVLTSEQSCMQTGSGTWRCHQVMCSLWTFHST